MLLEPELPRVLAPDLSSSCYSVGDLNRPHSNYQALRPGIDMSRHVLRENPIGNVARLLPTLVVGAVSQATSPGSNPNPLYPLLVRLRSTRSTRMIGLKPFATAGQARSPQGMIPDYNRSLWAVTRSLGCPSGPCGSHLERGSTY